MIAEAPQPVPGLALFIYASLDNEFKTMQDLHITLHVTNAMYAKFPALVYNKVEKIRFYQDNHGRLCVEDVSKQKEKV